MKTRRYTFNGDFTSEKLFCSSSFLDLYKIGLSKMFMLFTLKEVMSINVDNIKIKSWK